MEISIYSRPPEKISEKIRKIIKDIKKVFGNNRSSKAPLPHLTIRSSFKVSKNQFSEVCKILRIKFKNLKKPTLRINGWSVSPKNSDVCGFHLKVQKNSNLLKIHKKLENLFPRYEKTYTIKKFEPHISLAWNMKKEMKKKDFDNALEYLRKKRFKFSEHYIFDKLYIHEKIGKDKYKFVKILK